MKLARLTNSAVLTATLLVAGTLNAQQLAFPTAEGYGKHATGGRGGKVYEVTTLNASGPGSFGEALGASGPRIVVFKVAGTIEGDFEIDNGDITIAGQTAPGDGICIKGTLGTGAENVIIRYIRVGADPTSGSTDAIGGQHAKNLIFDHVSASWSSDEVMSLYHGENITIQWCMITEACAKGGEGHRFGGIWGNNYSTYHHNLIAHNDSRNPRWASGAKYNDYRNNVLYNWGYNTSYGGEKQQVGESEYNFSTINMIANYYKPGPATEGGVRDRIVAPSSRSGGDIGSWYVAENVVVGSPDVTEDNWKGVDGNEYERLDQPWDAMPINQQTPEEAYKAVLEHVGCSFPNRDAIDARIIEEVRNGTATHGRNGIITAPSDVGGWPELKSGEPPADGDHDGMPDAWETANGLNSADPGDGSKPGKDGYTNVENYLNGLVEKGAATSVEERQRNDFRLVPGLSDSFNSSARIELSVPVKSKVKLEVLDYAGRSVAILMNEVKEAGRYSLDFAGRNLRPGLYVCRLTTADKSLARKMFLMN